MHQKFFYMVMDEEKSMEAWIASVWDIAHRLEAADFEVMDIDLIIAMTQGLPDRYDPFIVSLDATPVDQLNVDSVIIHLLNENLVNIVITLERHYPSQSLEVAEEDLVTSLPRLNPCQQGTIPRSSHCYNCGGCVTFLGIAHHQSKRVIRLILLPRT